MGKIKFTGIIALIAAIAYVVIPVDYDISWHGYIDDFFVFMAGYSFFMGQRRKSLQGKRLLYLLSGCFFIVAMLVLICLILFK